MLKKSFAVLLCLFIITASTIAFAGDNDIPRPKIAAPVETVVSIL